MRRYRLLAFAMAAAIVLLFVPGLSNAQYWFQSGARAGNEAGQNNGASVSIQTVYQNVSNGSLGFWVGEDLSNGAFVQVGYEIVNSSGSYPRQCSPSGCNNYTFIAGGVPTWFWEYFPAGYNGNSFYGGIGGNASAGVNGTFNTYSFSSSGNTWYFYFNGNKIGSADMGTSTSGPNPPVALEEQAATYTTMHITPVKFRNLEYGYGSGYRLVPKGYAYVGYGSGSDTSIPNPYGVQEVDNYVDYMEVGSGIPIPANYSTLWSLGYSLTESSQYGNLSKVENYTAYSTIPLNSPQTINITKGVRVIFAGWVGGGIGSYTGPDNYTTITMNGNITEQASWKTQYYLNVSSQYGNSYGSGWYNASTPASFGLSQTTIPIAAGTRVLFDGWNGYGVSANSTVLMSGPKDVVAEWVMQYMLNATSPYGTVYGNGWYDSNSTATVSLNETAFGTGNSSRLAFEKWSKGYNQSSVSITMAAPVFMTAIFVPQYLIKFVPEDSNGNPIRYDYIMVDGMHAINSTYLDANTTYRISYAEYKGTQVSSNQQFTVEGPSTVSFKLPIYNVEYHASSVFGTPINASVNVTFKNGSTISFYLGPTGTRTIPDVPYGYSYGKISYLGIPQNIATGNGSAVSATMLTPSLIGLLVAGVIAIAVTAKLALIKEKKMKGLAGG